MRRPPSLVACRPRGCLENAEGLPVHENEHVQQRKKGKDIMKTEAISTNSQRTDDPGAAATPRFTPGSGGQNIGLNKTVTTNYTITLTESHGMAVIEATAAGLLPDDVFVALYPGPIPSNPDSGYLRGQWFWLESSSQSLQTSAPWGSGYYIGLSQKTYSGGDTSYTLICSAGPT
jgi:hypothetical protein